MSRDLSNLTDDEVRELRELLERTTEADEPHSIVKAEPVEQKSQLEKDIDDLRAQSSTKHGRIRSNWRRGKSEARTNLKVALRTEAYATSDLNTSIASAYTSEIAIQDAVHALHKHPEQLQRIDEVDRAMHENSMNIINGANQIGTTPDVYIEVQRKILLNQADLDAKVAEMREQVRLALISKVMTDHQYIILIGEILDGLYTQVDEIEHSNLSLKAKQRMIEDREAFITTLKEHMNGRMARFSQGDNWEDPGGGYEDTDLRRHHGPDTQGTAKRVSPKKPRGRPKRSQPQ